MGVAAGVGKDRLEMEVGQLSKGGREEVGRSPKGERGVGHEGLQLPQKGGWWLQSHREGKEMGSRFSVFYVWYFILFCSLSPFCLSFSSIYRVFHAKISTSILNLCAFFILVLGFGFMQFNP